MALPTPALVSSPRLLGPLLSLAAPFFHFIMASFFLPHGLQKTICINLGDGLLKSTHDIYFKTYTFSHGFARIS